MTRPNGTKSMSDPGVAPSPELPPGERPRFWSEADCKDVFRRLVRATTGGGVTTAAIWSTWTGYVRWARNLVSTAGETRTNTVGINRLVGRAPGNYVFTNDVSDAGLEAAVRHAERVSRRALEMRNIVPGLEALTARVPLEPLSKPQLFSDATYQLGAEQRTRAAQLLAQLAAAKGMLSAGYAQVSAHGWALFDSTGHVFYVPFTQAQYSVTVRDPKGTGSGWAGDSGWDWAKLDPDALTQAALDKCVKSQNPVRVEPGRYTAILEPQAVADLVSGLVGELSAMSLDQGLLDRWRNEGDPTISPGPFTKTMKVYPGIGQDGHPGYSYLGERVIDTRLSLSTDPADRALGYPPFYLKTGLFSDNTYIPMLGTRVFHPVTWIKDGVLQALSYSRAWGAKAQEEYTGAGLPNPGSFRLDVTGPTHTVDDMVASTKRGLLVTRFDQVQLVHERSTLTRGYTRDGLWLVENGTITKAAKNLQFTESIIAALNGVEQLGVPRHAFRAMGRVLASFPQPVIAPALKVSEFSFTALADAV